MLGRGFFIPRSARLGGTPALPAELPLSPDYRRMTFLPANNGEGKREGANFTAVA